MAYVERVRFIGSDPGGLWRDGEPADDLGMESKHPNAPPVRLLRLRRTGELIALTAPYARGIITPEPPGSPDAA
jgi:hypothetical protein